MSIEKQLREVEKEVLELKRLEQLYQYLGVELMIRRAHCYTRLIALKEELGEEL